MPQTTAQQAAYNKIARLIEHFAQQIDLLKKKQKEAETRIFYINPLFEALGWDIDNTKLCLPFLYKDVIHEAELKVGGKTKAPDYCFTNYGKPQFFLEAKKPAVQIKTEAAPSYQLRRYGWSAKLPVSILTDFEEFALYDCTKQPKETDATTVARLKYLTFDQYLAEFNWIWDLFAKEQVLKGSLNQFNHPDKKGTLGVDYAFLQSLDEWRNLFAVSIARQNESLNEDEINLAVQVNINRMVFFRNCEDRGIEPYGKLQQCLTNPKQEGAFFRNLFLLFQEADRKYNSGLFDLTHDALSGSIAIDNQTISTIVNNLYYPQSPYEFSVIGAEILGTAYERFLGKVIRLTPAHEVKVEDKPEVRKAGGVFYTPQYIVTYIVKNTIGKLITGKTPDEIARLKICDPACGSGSFLLGAYQYLLEYHTNYYAQHYKKSRNAKNSPLTPDGNLTTQVKKDILLNNIFGVDIDAQAVEVTKLSLLMKCLEGETQASMQTTLAFNRLLPTLEHNIQCGNALIDFDFYESQLDFGEAKKVKPFNWKQAFPQVFAPRERINQHHQHQLQRHYEWVKQQAAELEARTQDLLNQFEAHEPPMPYLQNRQSGGFDVVIGNPPYVYLPDKLQQKYFAAKYLYQDYQQDLYLLFLERYQYLLAPNGYFGVIISNTWLQSVLLKKIRRYLLQNYRWERFLHLPDRVFQDAVVDTHVLIFEKELPLVADKVAIEVYKKGQITLSHHLVQSELPQEGEPINIIAPPDERKLFDKIKAQSIALSELCEVYNGVKPFEKGKGTPPQTEETMRQKPYVAENVPQPHETWLPLLRGSLIHRYKNLWNHNSWILYGKHLAAPRDPRIFTAPQKIMVRQTGDSIIATLVGKDVIGRDNLHIILPKQHTNLGFILGILNSKLMDFCYRQINPEKGEALAQVKKNHVEILPLPPPDKIPQTTHDAIAQQAELLLQLNAQLLTETDKQKVTQLKGMIAFAEQKTDALVYAVYGLTPDEISLIERGG